MSFGFNDKLKRGDEDNKVANEWMRIETSTSNNEDNHNSISMRQASTDEAEEEFAALSLEDAQRIMEKLEGIIKDMEEENARRKEEIAREKARIEALQNALECGICLAVLKNPQILQCGHSACYGCLRSWWTRPIDGNWEPIVSTDEEDEDGVVMRPRRRFQSAVTRNKQCPICKKTITRRPAPSLMVNNMIKTMNSFLNPVPPRVQVQRDERGRPQFQDIWRGIFHEVEQERMYPEDSEIARQSREEVMQIRLELEETHTRHHQELQEIAVRINRLEGLISQERNEAAARSRARVDENS